MAQTVGQMFHFGHRPWIGRDTRLLPRAANFEEAVVAGGLDWRVELAPIHLGDDSAQEAIKHRRAVVRTDRGPGQSGRVVGVVHPHFRPLQNREGMQILDTLVGRGARVYHSGGYLGNGEIVWLQARLPTEITIGESDVIEPYLLYSNSHDGSRAIDIRLTTIRIACQNILNLALQAKSTTLMSPFRHAHRHSPDMLRHDAKEFFRLVLAQCEVAQQLFTRLSGARCTASDFKAFLTSLLPEPKRPVTADQNPAVRKGYETRVESILAARRGVDSVFRHGIPEQRISPAGDNWWGALNAVTGWVDHVQEVKSDRFAHMTFGSGDMLKGKALKLAQKAIA